MIWGEHLLADEASVQCQGVGQHCPDKAVCEVKDKHGVSCGWFCLRCAYDKRKELNKQQQLARASLRRVR
jgi:hypothetical protein